jgi:hypothetical protein
MKILKMNQEINSTQFLKASNARSIILDLMKSKLNKKNIPMVHTKLREANPKGRKNKMFVN